MSHQNYEGHDSLSGDILMLLKELTSAEPYKTRRASLEATAKVTVDADAVRLIEIFPPKRIWKL